MSDTQEPLQGQETPLVTVDQEIEGSEPVEITPESNTSSGLDIFRRHVPMFSFPPNQDIRFEPIMKSPRIVIIRNILTPKECEWLIEKAKPLMEPSTQIKGDKQYVGGGRTSYTAVMEEYKDVMPLSSILRRFAILVGKPVDCIESPKIVRYRKGQHYGAHYDFFGSDDSPFVQDGGDRMFTFLVYLNTMKEEDGGATKFTNLDYEVTPHQGDALFWSNIKPNGDYDYDTLHEGCPVLTDVEKYVVNIWVRPRES